MLTWKFCYDIINYIYDIEIEKELKKSSQNGVYYCTLLKGSISPTNSSVNSFSFSQNINYLYPTLDKDNPTEDPDATTSVASNTTIGFHGSRYLFYEELNVNNIY